jgi:ankyrin repeat protein
VRTIVLSYFLIPFSFDVAALYTPDDAIIPIPTNPINALIPDERMPRNNNTALVIAMINPDRNISRNIAKFLFIGGNND